MRYPSLATVRRIFSPSVILVLVLFIAVAAGGYYFWIQKRTERQQTENPVINRVEGVFTYVNTPDGENWIIEKMVLGTIEKIDGNLLTIKTDNNKTVQVLFTGENPHILNLTFYRPKDRPESNLKVGTMSDLVIGDVVRVGEIYSDDEGRITANFLSVVRSVNK